MIITIIYINVKPIAFVIVFIISEVMGLAKAGDVEGPAAMRACGWGNRAAALLTYGEHIVIIYYKLLLFEMFQ